MTEQNIKIYRKTNKSADVKYYFSTLYLTIGSHAIGNMETIAMTELLISGIEMMIYEAKIKKVFGTLKKK